MNGSNKSHIISWLLDDPSESWQQFGRTDPYYGVLSADQFRIKNLNAESLRLFFDSGEQHIEGVLQSARHVSPGMSFNAALDFGCGAGRLVLPLARRFQRVAGVDISSAYIAEAKKNCKQQGFENVEFTETISVLQDRNRTFDFIHSCIVFQHIPWRLGQEIIEQLFRLLNPYGVMAIGVIHHQEISGFRRVARQARKFLPLHYLINALAGRPIFEPLMQCNEYPLDQLIPILHRLGARGVHIQPHAGGKNEYWATLFCTREAF